MAPHLNTSAALLIIFLTLSSSPSNSASFNFSSFQPNPPKITFQGDAFAAGNAIHLTKELQGEEKKQSCGRVIYEESVHLWDQASMVLADFTTHFTFIMNNLSNYIYSGDGLAFFIAANGSQIPRQYSKGGYLCLFSNNTSVSLNSTSSAPTVAVEFDTYSNTWDPMGETTPDGNHIGIDINSILSIKTKDWPTRINQGKTGKAWIDYNASTMELGVFLSFEEETFYNRLFNLSDTVDLRLFLPEWVSVGFSAATGVNLESHRILTWEFSSNLERKIQERNMGTSPSPNPGSSDMGGNYSTNLIRPSSKSELNKKNKKRTIIVVVVVLILAAIVGVISLIWFIVWHKRAGGKQENRAIEVAIDEQIEQNGGPKRFSYSDLSTATNNFSAEGLLGKGGFGSVHKGFLKDRMNIIPVAVKKLSKDSKQGIKEYISEVRAISRLGHKNLVKLIGWCHEGGELLLVYKFMPNGSLDLHLFGDKFEPIPWMNRLNIVRGLMAALFYLHEQCEHCVLHRDIKSSNVMLDSNFDAKLGDFGLAREIDHEEDGRQSSLAAGTFGYLAPEYYHTKKATKESDIYSFGIVLLEVACGRKPIDPQRVGEVVMVDWVWNLYGTKQVLDAADDRLNGEFNEDEMERLILTGLWCAHPVPNSRPSIREVINVLDHDVSLPLLPSKMPAAPYSAMSSRSASGVTSSHNGRSQSSSNTGGSLGPQ